MSRQTSKSSTSPSFRRKRRSLAATATATATLALALLSAAAEALQTPELRQRSIYQVITDRFALPGGRLDGYCDPAERKYCGGTWKGIESKLAYIQGMGFDTVWISPVVANIDGVPGKGPHPPSESYHGYWASDIWQLNSHFGTPEDLTDLSNALHARGMYLMVDIVANHVGTVPDHFEPGKMYGPFDKEEHFHPFCLPVNWNNQLEAEQCWLSDHMADLNTENESVVVMLQSWVHHLVNRFHIDAIRIDTVKHIRKDFWPGFVAAGGVAAVGEVWHGNPAFLRPYQERSLDSILDYATFYHLRRAFQNTQTSIDELTSMITRVHREMRDPTLLASFLENHDTPRMPSFVSDRALLKNAVIYPFINDGYPMIYSGQEHGLAGGDDPLNREAIWHHGYSPHNPLFATFTRLNLARRRAMALPLFHGQLLKHFKLDPHTVVIAKLPLVSILTNVGSQAPPRVHFLPSAMTTFAPRMAVIDVLTGQVYATDPSGGLSVAIVAGEPRVFLPLGIFEGQRQVVWQHQQIPHPSPAGVGSPAKKQRRIGSPSHSRGSSFSSVMSWFGKGSR